MTRSVPGQGPAEESLSLILLQATQGQAAALVERARHPVARAPRQSPLVPQVLPKPAGQAANPQGEPVASQKWAGLPAQAA